MNSKQINSDNKFDDKVCKIKRKQKPFELFKKSLKFLVCITGIIFTFVSICKYVFNLNPLYPLFAIGAFCALTATYYKIRMMLDPNYKPDCNCYDNQSFTEEAMNGVLSVLEHKRATLLFNIPNSVYGIFFYIFMIVMIGWDTIYSDLIIKTLNVISLIGSCWLWYIMVTEVKNICFICTTIHSVNFLAFYYLFY